MIQIPVKVSGITSLTDARYCAGMGVQFLGIQLDGIGARISPIEFKSIRAWIEGIEWVGEYSGDSGEEVKMFAQEYGLDFLEVSNRSLVLPLMEGGFKVGVKQNDLSIDAIFDRSISYICAPIPEEFYSELKIWMAQHPSIPVLIQSVSTISDLKFAMVHLPECGFNFESGEEERPGWMDLSALQDLLEILEEVS